MSDDDIYATTDEPISLWFSLSYASYLVLPRTILEDAPVEWQRRMACLLAELDQHYRWPPDGQATTVHLRAEGTRRFVSDPLRNYRRPSAAALQAVRTEPWP